MPSPSASSIMLFAIILLGLFLFWRANRSKMWTTVYAWEHGFYYENGRFGGELQAGRYLNNLPFRRRDIVTLRRNEQIHQTGVMDVTSRDKFVFRISAQFIYRIVDARLAYEEQYISKIDLAVKTALLKAISDSTLEALLAERDSAGKATLTAIAAPVAGCEISALVITNLTLPPELRRLFIEVERAKLEGLASLERARGEHAALRSLANAAGLLKDNPNLMNLRLLQSVDGASGKGNITLVVGQDGIPVVGSSQARN